MGAGGSPRWRPASVTLTNMATSEGTTFTSAEGAGTSTAGEAGEFVEVVLERALPGHTATEGATEGHTATVGSAAGPLHARPVPEEHAASSLLSDYALTLHVQPGLRSGRMQLLVNLRGDGEPHETGPRVCRAMAAGRGRAVAALDGAPDVGELRACELAVVESGGSATHEPSAVLEMVTVENFSTGAVYHCASRRYSLRPDLYACMHYPYACLSVCDGMWRAAMPAWPVHGLDFAVARFRSRHLVGATRDSEWGASRLHNDRLIGRAAVSCGAQTWRQAVTRHAVQGAVFIRGGGRRRLADAAAASGRRQCGGTRCRCAAGRGHVQRRPCQGAGPALRKPRRSHACSGQYQPRCAGCSRISCAGL